MTTDIQIFKDYPEQDCIPLVPVKTITQLSPLHTVSIKLVQISSNPDDKDVYQEKNKEFALTKRGLRKLMNTANIQMIESKKVPASSCQTCLEMAKVTGKPSSCVDCPCKNDIAYQVTIAIPDLSGGVRKEIATREFLCSDERKKCASDKQYQGAFAFRAAQCESKALNRALRSALMLKSTYKAQELSKPFAVPVISLNYDDKDLKAAAIARFAKGEDILFGTPSLDEPEGFPALPVDVTEAEIIPADEVEEYNQADEWPPDVNSVPQCFDCGAIIEPFKDRRTGDEWGVDRVIAYSEQHFGHPLCSICIAKRRRGAKK